MFTLVDLEVTAVLPLGHYGTGFGFFFDVECHFVCAGQCGVFRLLHGY